jgi:hypothetical protein
MKKQGHIEKTMEKHKCLGRKAAGSVAFSALLVSPIGLLSNFR